MEREYTDLQQLRRDVVALIRAGRYKFSYHAQTTHSEIPPEEKRAVVLYGTRDQPNRHSKPGQPSYVCWYPHPDLGLLRAAYAVVEPPEGGQVRIITVFKEEGRRQTLGRV